MSDIRPEVLKWIPWAAALAVHEEDIPVVAEMLAAEERVRKEKVPDFMAETERVL